MLFLVYQYIQATLNIFLHFIAFLLFTADIRMTKGFRIFYTCLYDISQIPLISVSVKF